MPKRKRVVVAMSGGVDSSVAAGLLQQAGYEVLGVTMRLWTQEDAATSRHHKRCCSVEDTDDARAAAQVLGIRHYVLNLEREFAENVVNRFVREYTLGRTPNPCSARARACAERRLPGDGALRTRAEHWDRF
jgi:tRNA-specific 2-thiouridylase